MSDDALPDSHRRQAERNAGKVAQVAPADPLTPAGRYQELFVAVQTDAYGIPWLAYCVWWLAGSGLRAEVAWR